MADGKAKGAEAVAEVAVEAAKVDAIYSCLDVSGSIRGEVIYPDWVTEDIKKTLSPGSTAVEVKWILWGSEAATRDSLEDVVKYLAGQDTLGGTEPLRFVEKLPSEGTIDLHVYTDGEICEGSVKMARTELDRRPNLKIRQVVINYVNKNLDSMNVGLSAIFDGFVLEMHRTRVADGKKVHQFDAAPLDATVSFGEIISDYLGIDKTEAHMTKGIHYLAQRFANADPKLRQDIRRLVREHADAVNRDHRTKFVTPEEEKEMLAALDDKKWMALRAPFIGHSVAAGVKLVQAYSQKFLNETRHGALIRISAYAPMQLRGKDSGGGQFDPDEDVLLDHIMYLGLGNNAIIVLPATLPPKEPRRRGQRVPAESHIKCGLNSNAIVNYDNSFGLETMFQLRDQQNTDGVSGWDVAPNPVHVLDQLSAQAHGEPAPVAEALSSTAHTFGVNPFNRQHMECVFLVPACAESLPAERLAEVDRWNAHMLSRFVRSGRTMPSVPLLLALVMEKAFLAWNSAVRPEDKAEADKLKAVLRKYIARMQSPLTFSVGLPVILQGTFSTAARLAVGVLQGVLDPSLRPDVLTQFWSTIPDSEEAAKVWAVLCVYAGVPDDTPFPKDLHRTLLALVAGAQYTKSARDLKLREKKGRAYSIRMYNKRLDQLAKGGCHPDRLRAEEKEARKDLLGVPTSEPLLCVHGVDVDLCRPSESKDVDTICHTSCRPTLLNEQTMDMWYVGQPENRSELALQSFHKAMWQLVRKRNKGKRPRHGDFPPSEVAFMDFVNHRVRAAYLERGSDGDYSTAQLLPTVPCPRLKQDIETTYYSYVKLVEGTRGARSLNRKRFVKALRAKREVCAFEPCCEFIRKAVTEDQLRWIDEHATYEQVGDNLDILSGKVSYRQG